MVLRSYRSGAILSHAPLNGDIRDQAPYFLVHRADYQRILATEAVRLGVRILLDFKVEHIDLAVPAITARHEERIVADLLLCADGVHSPSRAKILQQPVVPPRATGDCAYRIVLPAFQLLTQSRDDRLRDLIASQTVTFWLGPWGHVVGYPIRGGALYNVVLCCPDDIPTDVPRGRRPAKEVRELFADWDPVLLQLLTLADTAEVVQWRLMDIEPLPTWRADTGKVALLGDACHASLPYLAQGAALSIEDGAVLGDLFQECHGKEDIPLLLAAFESIRRPRTSHVVERSRALRDQVMHLPDGEAQRARDDELRENRLRKGFPNPWKDPVLMEWLFGYSVEGEVQASLERLEVTVASQSQLRD